MAELAGTAGLDLVIETLAAALPSFDRKARSLHALLELPVEELFCACRSTPAALRSWLVGIAGSSRPATASTRSESL